MSIHAKNLLQGQQLDINLTCNSFASHQQSRNVKRDKITLQLYTCQLLSKVHQNIGCIAQLGSGHQLTESAEHPIPVSSVARPTWHHIWVLSPARPLLEVIGIPSLPQHSESPSAHVRSTIQSSSYCDLEAYQASNI